MPDEMSPGEIGRTLRRIEGHVDNLRQGFDGWREIIIRLDHQVQENIKDIATLQQAQQDRRDTLKKVVIPIIVGIVLGGAAFFAQLWAAFGGVST